MKISIPRRSFYFVRHGETDWNKEHKLMGSADIALNEVGRDQAENAAYIMQELNSSIIYSSSLSRAIETANIISEICLLEVVLIKDLQERSMGEAEGKQKNDLIFELTSDENLPKGAEKAIDFRKRVLNSLSYCLGDDKNIDPLIVSHGGVFQVLTEALTNHKNIKINNGEVFCFSLSSFQHDKWDLIKL